MSDSTETDVSTCSGCGAPLPLKPTIHHPVKCEYCDLTNYLKRSALSTAEVKIADQELEAEDYYLIYQETQKILENFPGELIGEEVGKVRIKMQVNEYAFPILIVLDDLPDRPYIDVPTKLREILNCEISDLKTMKEWTPGTSSVLNVLEELYQQTEAIIPQVLGETSETLVKPSETIQEEKDPLVRKIMNSYDASADKKEIVVKFYAQDGEVIDLVIKRKKNLPIGLESDILTRYPLIRGPLEDYAKGRIDLLTTLAEIERMLYI